jgi:hypothetical protein
MINKYRLCPRERGVTGGAVFLVMLFGQLNTASCFD